MRREPVSKIITSLLIISVLVSLTGMRVNAQTREEYVSQFVERMYTMVLGRPSEQEGHDYWTSRILSGQTSGADCAFGFFESAEYKNAGITDDVYVSTLYRVILGRESDPGGLNYWMSYLAGGTPRSYVLAGFVNSVEYDGICSSYGIVRGSLPMNAALARTGIAGFISPEGDALYMRDAAGNLLMGWHRNGSNRYYFDPADGGRAATGWIWIDGLKYYFDEEHRLVQNVDPLIGPQSSYYVTVNCGTQTVMIYAQDTAGGSYNVPVRAMVCSTGKPGHGTIQGTYSVTRGNRWGLLFDDHRNVYGQYVSIIRGNYLFHSCWYYENGNVDSLSVSEYNRLGSPASHGCVRLSVEDARWIWENVASNNSSVRIFTSNEASPLDRPDPQSAIVISGDRGHDPTDT